MSYIPPHKRSTSSSSTPPCQTPTPHSLQPRYNTHSHAYQEEKQIVPKTVTFDKNIVCKWFPVGLVDDSQLPFLTHLSPFPFQVYDLRNYEKTLPMVLNYHHDIKEDGEGVRKHPWDYIVENVQAELFSSFERVKRYEIGEVETSIVARFGKIVFQGKDANVNDVACRNKTFYTNVPLSYIDYMSNEVVSKLELNFEQENELYIPKIFDKRQPRSALSCKCTVLKDHGRLELLKVESSPVRHFAADMSCLAKELDLRLALSTKKIMTDLTDDEMESIKLLISSATIDPEVKGGLRWPLGKNSSGDRYSVCSFAHTTTKTYSNSSIRLTVRQVERFDVRTKIGENTGEVSLKMCGVVSLLQEPTPEIESISQMLKHNIRLIWEHFLDGRSAFASTQV